MLSMDKLFSMLLLYYLVESFSIWDQQNHGTANSIRINALVSLQCFFTNDVDQLNSRGLYLRAQFVCPVPVFRLSFNVMSNELKLYFWIIPKCKPLQSEMWAYFRLVNCYNSTFLPTEGWPVPLIGAVFEHVAYAWACNIFGKVHYMYSHSMHVLWLHIPRSFKGWTDDTWDVSTPSSIGFNWHPCRRTGYWWLLLTVGHPKPQFSICSFAFSQVGPPLSL